MRRVNARHACNLLDADDAFMLGLVGKHRRSSDIADRVEPGTFVLP